MYIFFLHLLDLSKRQTQVNEADKPEFVKSSISQRKRTQSLAINYVCNEATFVVSLFQVFKLLNADPNAHSNISGLGAVVELSICLCLSGLYCVVCMYIYMYVLYVCVHMYTM